MFEDVKFYGKVQQGTGESISRGKEMGQDAILKEVARVSLMRRKEIGKDLKEMEEVGQVII